MKRAAITIATIAVFTATTFAGFSGSIPEVIVYSVEQVQELRDDTPVKLMGFIIQQHDEETYTFRDITGEMLVEIEPEDFRDLEITPTTKVKIIGEVDKRGRKRKIDVEYIDIL